MDNSGNSGVLKAVQNLLAILRLDRRDIGAIYFFAILAGLIALSLPLGIQSIIGLAQAGQLSASVIVLITFVVVGVFLNGLIQVRQMQLIEKMEQKIITRYALTFAAILPKLDVEKLSGYYLPELINRFFDVPAFTKSLKKLLIEIPAAILQVFFGLILLSFYHPIFISFGALLIILALAVLRLTSAKGLATSLQESDFKYKIGGWLEEVAREAKTFIQHSNIPLHIAKADELNNRFLQARTSHFKILLIQYWAFISFKTLMTAAMLVIGSILLIDNKINVGQFVAAEIVIISIVASVEKLILSLDSLYDALTSVQKLEKITGGPMEETGQYVLDAQQGIQLSVRGLTFSYPNSKPILHQINFEAKPGQINCIIGASGAGKTTLLKSVLGFHQNYSGSILLNQVPVGNYSSSSMRAHMGVLWQSSSLFEGTILENISLTYENVALSPIADIAEKVGILSFIQNLKNGFDTQVTPMGYGLPAHIRQSILLLRALVGHKELLLLEEPFDQLQPSQIQSILNYLTSLSNCTIVIFSANAQLASQIPHCWYLQNGQLNSSSVKI